MAAQGDVFRLAARMRLSGTADAINVWHCRISDYVAGSDAVVAQEMVDRLSTGYQLIDQDLSGMASADISVQNVTTGAVLGTFAWNPVMGAGTGGDATPPQTSLFAYFRTGISRRIGRKFVGMIAESAQNNGTVIGSVVTALGNFAAFFIVIWVGATTSNEYEWGVYNGSKSPVFLRFVEAVVRNVLMTQRRRRYGVGA